MVSYISRDTNHSEMELHLLVSFLLQAEAWTVFSSPDAE